MYNESDSHDFTSTSSFSSFSGTIVLFKGDCASLTQWFQDSPCKYCKVLGWYCDYVPSPLPYGIEPVILHVPEKTPESVLRKMATLALYPSRPQGRIGERLERSLTITKIIPKGTQCATYVFEDANSNTYFWNTKNRNLSPNKTYTLRGTVKAHTESNQTVLTRCTIVERN